MMIEAIKPKIDKDIWKTLKQEVLTMFIAKKRKIRKFIKLPNHDKTSKFILI